MVITAAVFGTAVSAEGVAGTFGGRLEAGAWPCWVPVGACVLDFGLDGDADGVLEGALACPKAKAEMSKNASPCICLPSFKVPPVVNMKSRKS